MMSCSSWYCICSIVEYVVSSVVSILYCKFLIDDICKKECPLERALLSKYEGNDIEKLPFLLQICSFRFSDLVGFNWPSLPVDIGNLLQ